MLEALRIRDFRLLLSARLVSLLGSWLLVVAVPAYVFKLTGSVAATGLTLAAEFLPPAVLGPVAGALADRWDRRHVMIAADVVRAIAVALLLFVREPGDIWLLYVALMVESVGTVVFGPAAQSHTPVVVGTGTALSSANALNAVTDGAVRLIGAPVGGALFAWAGFEVLVGLDLCTYLLSAVAILLTARLPGPVDRAADGTRRVLADVREGLAFLRADRTARSLLLVNTLFLGANACLTALLIPYGVTVLGGTGQIGAVMSALGVGFLLGAPLLRVLVDRMAPGHLLGGALALTGAGFVLLFSTGAMPTALLAALLIGVAGSVALGTTQTTLQRTIPNHMLGRISATMFTGEAVATLGGAVVGPALAQALSIAAAAHLAGAATALSGLLGALLLSRKPPVLAARTARSVVPREPRSGSGPGPPGEHSPPEQVRPMRRPLS
ncbi:MFS transporter [Actinoplanes sp. CA-054009]